MGPLGTKISIFSDVKFCNRTALRMAARALAKSSSILSELLFFCQYRNIDEVDGLKRCQKLSSLIETLKQNWKTSIYCSL